MDLEHDFTAWVDHQDPAALARVFDGTAGRLLLLAAQLGGRGTDTAPEDLLQATFLAAIARSSTWDRQRPVLPWLAAILLNEARAEWRRGRRRRRREVGIVEAEGCASPTGDPAHLAASEEAFTAVIEAIDALPLPYRQVLRLRLLHGLQNVEIARALERPVGTVRAQVHRGLARLREALPIGLTGGLGGGLAWGGLGVGSTAASLGAEGLLLAQVRTRVIAEATAMSAAKATAATTTVTTATKAAAGGTAAHTGSLSIGGSWLVKGKTIGSLAAGAALLLLFCGAFGMPPFSDAEGGAVRPPVATGEGSGPGPGASPAAHPPPVRHELGLAGTEAGTWPLVVTVRDDAGNPIEGAGVRVWIPYRSDLRTESGVDIASGRTGTDGTFRCTLDDERRKSPLLRSTSWLAVSARYGSRFARELTGLPRNIQARRFAVELQLRPALAVVGRVVDESGLPVEDAELHWLSSSTTGGTPDPAFAYSGSDGSFRMQRRNLDPHLDGVAAVHPERGIAVAALPASGPPSLDDLVDVGTLVLAAEHGIRGRVVLGDGTGLGGVPLFVQLVDGDAAKGTDPFFASGKLRSCEDPTGGRRRLVQAVSRPVTAADGSFQCGGLLPGAQYTVAVVSTEMQMIGTLARVGGEPVHLVVERQLLLVDVRDEVGEALPNARVVAAGFAPGSGSPGSPAAEKRFRVRTPAFPTDAQGRRMLLSPFGWQWQIDPLDVLAQDQTLTHEAFAGTYRVERSLVLRTETRFGSLRLTVVDEHGQPWSQFGLILRGLDHPQRYRDHQRMTPVSGGVFDVDDLVAGRWQLTTYLGREALFPLLVHVRGAVTQEVVIEEGRRTEVQVETAPAGVVSFRPHSATPPASGAWEDLRIRSALDGAEVPYHVLDADETWARDPSRTYGRLFLGSTAFRPGRQEFVVTAAGYRAARCVAQVVADRRVRVDVELFIE